MKRILVATLLILGTVGLFAAQPAVGVTGTFHDLSTTGYRTATNSTQVCVFCHTPHGAYGSVSGGNIAAQLIPLWNHTTTAGVYTMYNNTNNPIADLQGTVDASPTGASLACLSCHDGTIAVGAGVQFPYGWPGSGVGGGAALSYASYTGTWINPATGIIIPGTPVYVGTDLTNDHPIAITYQDNLDTGLNPPAGLVGVKLFPTNATGSKVQCGSCHDPHNFGTSGVDSPFLRASMVGSAMCLQCHIK
jgi:cytochrome c553